MQNENGQNTISTNTISNFEVCFGGLLDSKFNISGLKYLWNYISNDTKFGQIRPGEVFHNVWGKNL